MGNAFAPRLVWAGNRGIGRFEINKGRLTLHQVSWMLKVDRIAFLDWNEISFEVKGGEAIGILGSSGSGKSLLLRAIADLIPHRGEASLEGEKCSEIDPTQWRRRVTYLSSEALWWEDTIRAHFYQAPKIALLQKLGLESDCLTWEPSRLSTGERQRLGVLRMLDRNPEAMLLDEPTSNLDEANAKRVEALLLDYISEKQVAAVWVTHDPSQSSRIATRSLEMRDKRLGERSDQ